MAEKITQLTDEMAASIWSGGTASIAGLEESQVEVENPDDGEKVIDVSQASPVEDDDISKVFSGELEDTDEPEEVVEAKPKEVKAAPTKGKKPTEPLSFVAELIEEGDLLEYEDGLPKNLSEAKALIKANLERVKEEAIESAFADKKKTYSPQIQTILDFADQGYQSASELMDLIGAIKDVEDVNEIDSTTPEGAEAIVREAYKAKGFKEAYIEKNIKRLKDLDALKEEADELAPELVTAKAQKVKRKLQEQADRQADALEASKVYFTTIQKALNKEVVGGVKLAKEDKAKIFRSLADDSHTSLSGSKTNGFIKTLEDLQFGENADYDHFLNVVQFTVDPKGFIEKLKAGVKEEVTADTVRKLKSARTAAPNTQDVEQEPQRKVIKRATFKNPYE